MSRIYLLIAAGCVAVSGLCHAANIVLEAESATELEKPMVLVREASPPEGVTPVPGASAKAYLAIPQGAGNPPEVDAGKAVFEFDAPKAGLYILWIRAYWDDSCGNSVGVVINGGAPFMIEDTTYLTWHWVRSPPRLRQLALPAGRVRLELLNREDGIRIDQILLTTNKRYIPVDIETATVAPSP